MGFYEFSEGAIAGIVLEPAVVHHDERGWLCELFRQDEADVPPMAYVSVTRPGVVRGPHEHLHQTDRFCFLESSRFDVWLWDNRPSSATHGRAVHLSIDRPSKLVVPPRIVHAYRNAGPADALIVNMPDRLYRGVNRGETPDEVRHEMDPDSPFRVPSS